jgi:hypothetical protein
VTRLPLAALRHRRWGVTRENEMRLATFPGMEPSDPASTLGDEDLLSLWVGRVARVHALLEYNLSNVHGALLPSDTASVRRMTPPGVDSLIVLCRRRLITAELSDEVTTAGAQALSAAQAANALRNRIVHDIWLLDSQGEPRPPSSWNTLSRSKRQGSPYDFSTPRTLESVISAHTMLARSRLRISGLFMALHELLPSLLDARRFPSGKTEVPRYIAMMEDRFTIQPNGDIEIHQAE